MNTQLNEGQRRRRLKWVLLPLVVLVPLTVMFYVVKGWLGSQRSTRSGQVVRGMNMSLPDALLKTKGSGEDKMGYYEKAAADSARLAEKRKLDPYSADSGRSETSVRRDSGTGRAMPVGVQGLGRTRTDEQAQRVLQQVAEMRRVLAESSASGTGPGLSPGMERQSLVEVGRLTGPLPGVRVDRDLHRDPQLEQLDGMLDKLIRVQHPDMARQDSPVEPVTALTVTVARDEGEASDGFMEIGGVGRDSTLDQEAAIPAVVEADQVLTTGSTVALRLLAGVVIAGHAVEKDQLLYGLAMLKGERLEITVHSLRAGSAILPVNLQVYDLDGLLGIRVPGAIVREVSKESADEALNGINVMSVDQSLGAQAASAGMQFARSLAGRKIKLVRVAVPAGYQVLLKNVKR